MHDVFISYSSKDQKIADAVVNFLEAARIRCWISYRDGEAGNHYAGVISNAIKECEIFLLVFSGNSNISEHVLREVNLACTNRKTIIPFKIDDVQLDTALEYYLGTTHWLDAIKPPMEPHLKNLVKIISHNIQRTEHKEYAPQEYSLAANGDDSAENYLEAFEKFQLEAQKGDSAAMYNLGVCYKNGRGVMQSYEKAFEWFFRAANLGISEAQALVGLFYYHGEGVQQSYEKAVKWITIASDRGDAMAQYTLGIFYIRGHGVPPSNEKAVEMIKKSAKQGYQEAVAALKQLGIPY